MDKKQSFPELNINSFLPGKYAYSVENNGYKVTATFQEHSEMMAFINSFHPMEDDDEDGDFYGDPDSWKDK